MTKILEIINLPSSAKNFIGGQFKYLHEKGGFEMHLICSPGDNIEDFASQNNIHYYPVNLSRQLSPWRDLKSLCCIVRYLRRNKIDMVIAHQAKARLLGMIACSIARVPHRIVFAHGILYETMTGIKRTLVKLNDKYVSWLADKVVCVSKYVANFREKDHIDKSGKTIILGNGSCNGIDIEQKFNPDRISPIEIAELKSNFGIDENQFVIGFVGRLVRDKGVIELNESFRFLRKRHPKQKITLLVIGEPEFRDSLPTSTLEYLRNGEDIIFTGQVPFSKIQTYYMLMNVLVLPTHREGLGMVALEAEAMGVPAIVSGYTGSAETVINGKTGYNIDKTPESIICAVEKLLDKASAAAMGEKGREFVSKHFSHTKYCELMLQFIETELKKR